MSQVIMEKILALIRKNYPLISDVMWPCHLLPVLPTLYPDYPGHGNCFCCIIVIPTLHHIWPHTVCGMQWSQLQLSIVIIYYREQSGSVSPVSSSSTSPDGGSAPSWLSPTGRSRCHLVRETDDRNGFISALRRLCNVITLMWFILAFRHADHRPAPASTRHFYCSPDTAINTRQADQTII